LRERICRHRVAAIQNQIEKHLLELDAVAQNLRRAFGQRGVDRDAAPDQITAGDAEHVLNDFIHEEWQPLGLARLQEGAQSANDLTRPRVLAHDVRENLSHPPFDQAVS
jgi:hypothetical protein